MSIFTFLFDKLRSAPAGREPPSEPVTGKAVAESQQIQVETRQADVVQETAQALTIWTIERSRTSSPRALCTDIEIFPSQAVELHEGIMGYVLDTPNGETVVIEADTGSLVGQSLDHVRDSVRELSKADLKQQLDTARREFNRLKKTELDNDEFWQAIRMGGTDADVVQDFAE